MKILLLCVLLLGGCAAATPLPPLRTQPLQAQFGLRFSHAGMSVPLQGAVQMTEHGGSLGVIFPHGRTLGVCRYQTDGMECTPSGEDSSETRFMLRQIGLALYRILPVLAQEPGRDITEADWAVHWGEADTGRNAEYRDLSSRVTMEMHVTEFTRL